MDETVETNRQGALLTRIAEALERLAPPGPQAAELEGGGAFVWQGETARLKSVARVACIDLSLLYGIDRARDVLLENTRRFADGLPANNALLWGARGMGKSSLVKAVHAECSGTGLAIIEIHRDDIATLPRLMDELRSSQGRFLVFCDDLSFDRSDAAYKSLKAVLEGGIEGRPPNVLFYATSNRRHLMPRDMADNERQHAINPGEAVEEMISLSDRFGLWLGFHSCSQDDYLAMVSRYASHYGLEGPWDEIRADAVEWAHTRGARSGRVAWQFVQDLAGRLGVRLSTSGKMP